MSLTKTRSPQVAVRAIIVDESNRILIIRRGATNYFKGYWNLPGGKIDFGETAEAALKKEIREETSLDLMNSRFLYYMDNLPHPGTDLHFVTLFLNANVRE